MRMTVWDCEQSTFFWFGTYNDYVKGVYRTKKRMSYGYDLLRSEEKIYAHEINETFLQERVMVPDDENGKCIFCIFLSNSRHK